MRLRPLAPCALLLALSITSPASASAADPAGDVAAPADRGLAITLPDGVIVSLEAGARGRWLPKGRLPSEVGTWTSGYHLVLAEGELDVRMPDGEKGRHAFLVQTRAGTLTDWRGKLHVAVHDDRTTAAIYQGALVVGSNGQGFPVYDGAGILMQKGVDPDKSRAVPAAPAWDSARGAPSLVVEPTGARGQLGVSWGAVPGAATYRVAVSRDAAMTQIDLVASTADTTYAMVERGAGGCWASVRAIGPEGIVGEWSAPRPLRVVHFAVPPGAEIASDGAVVLADRTSVTLADADGLEVAYSTTPVRSPGALYWSPLAGALRLPDEGPTRIVHMRDPALGQATTLTLVRRSLHVDVTMTPRSPPSGAAIDVRAVALDPTGRLDPTREKVTLEASLDLDPLPAPWVQAGNTWTARLRPPLTFRPRVVRVVAKDGLGKEIGRGFVEITPGAPAP